MKSDDDDSSSSSSSDSSLDRDSKLEGVELTAIPRDSKGDKEEKNSPAKRIITKINTSTTSAEKSKASKVDKKGPPRSGADRLANSSSSSSSSDGDSDSDADDIAESQINMREKLRSATSKIEKIKPSLEELEQGERTDLLSLRQLIMSEKELKPSYHSMGFEDEDEDEDDEMDYEEEQLNAMMRARFNRQ